MRYIIAIAIGLHDVYFICYDDALKFQETIVILRDG
jgi:hypothetical protein